MVSQHFGANCRPVCFVKVALCMFTFDCHWQLYPAQAPKEPSCVQRCHSEEHFSSLGWVTSIYFTWQFVDFVQHSLILPQVQPGCMLRSKFSWIALPACTPLIFYFQFNTHRGTISKQYKLSFFFLCFSELPKKEIPLTSEQELALLTDYVSFLEN